MHKADKLPPLPSSLTRSVEGCDTKSNVDLLDRLTTRPASQLPAIEPDPNGAFPLPPGTYARARWVVPGKSALKSHPKAQALGASAKRRLPDIKSDSYAAPKPRV